MIEVNPQPTLEGVQRLLHGLAQMGMNLAPFFRVAGVILHDATEQAFATESSPAGQSWAPLARSTAMKFVTKSKRRGQHPILQVTGRLAGSFQTRATDTYAEHGTNLVYARVQHAGGGPSNIPARPFVGLGLEHLDDLAAEAITFAEEYAASVQASTLPTA